MQHVCLFVVITRFGRGSSGGVVVNLLACGARSPGFDSQSPIMISEIGYLLLPSCDMAEIWLKRSTNNN